MAGETSRDTFIGGHTYWLYTGLVSMSPPRRRDVPAQATGIAGRLAEKTALGLPLGSRDDFAWTQVSPRPPFGRVVPVAPPPRAVGCIGDSMHLFLAGYPGWAL